MHVCIHSFQGQLPASFELVCTAWTKRYFANFVPIPSISTSALADVNARSNSASSVMSPHNINSEVKRTSSLGT